MKFTLVENLNEAVLNEATEPQYKNIIFELIYYITTDEKLRDLIKNSKDSLEIHHIDAMYEYLTRVSKNGNPYKIGRALNNKPSNLAIVTKEAHQELTQINNEIKRKVKESGKEVEEAVPIIIESFKEQLKKFENQIFPLLDCLPSHIVELLSLISED